MVAMRTVVVDFRDKVVSQILLHRQHPDVRARLVQLRLYARRGDGNSYDSSRGVGGKGDSWRNEPLPAVGTSEGIAECLCAVVQIERRIGPVRRIRSRRERPRS